MPRALPLPPLQACSYSELLDQVLPLTLDFGPDREFPHLARDFLVGLDEGLLRAVEGLHDDIPRGEGVDVRVGRKLEEGVEQHARNSFLLSTSAAPDQEVVEVVQQLEVRQVEADVRLLLHQALKTVDRDVHTQLPRELPGFLGDALETPLEFFLLEAGAAENVAQVAETPVVVDIELQAPGDVDRDRRV